nr:type II toxin-antitoxin system RelE/ParE family toxin [Escherichia coli]
MDHFSSVVDNTARGYFKRRAESSKFKYKQRIISLTYVFVPLALKPRDKNIARTLYAYAMGNEIYLLHAFVKKTPTKAIEIARMRLKEMK